VDRFRWSGQGDARLITRDNLLGSLDRAATGKVTIISAPAGSGKSSLLRAWAARPGRPGRLAVVQVHRDQRDAQDFWLALLDAVRGAAVTDASTEPSAAAPQVSAPTMVDRILGEFAAVDGDLTLVIEDLHDLNCPETLGELSRLLANLSQRSHAILTTRHDLPLHLHQLRLTGELAEIRMADLRFKEQEARELLAASGVELSPAGVALLHRRTEGWAAGLRLAALSLAGHPDPERFVAEFSGSHRTVAEYLLAEMLERQPADVQHLLLRTCVLDRVNGELADLLTGSTGSERILLDLEDANAFVVSLDPERTWFRYHHLFGDLLRLELRRTFAAETPELHRRAARWFSEHGQVIEAIRHTQAAGAWREAARLLADHCFSLTLDGHTQALQALLKPFPPGSHEAPELALAHATAELATGHLDEAAAYLSIARSRIVTASDDHLPRLRFTVEALELWMARRRGDLAAAVEQAAIIDLPVPAASDREIALAGDLRAAAMMNLGTVEAWSLRLPDAERHLQEGAALARQIGRPYLQLGCLAELSYASKGRSFATAVRRCREAIALAERHGWSTEPVVAPALVTLADRLIWMAELDEAEIWLRRASHALRSDAGPGIGLLLHLTTGMLRAARGNNHEALEEFAAADSLRSRLAVPPTLATQVTGWTLAALVRAGKIAEARAALAALPDGRAGGAEISTAETAICLADGDPAGAVIAVKSVLDHGTAAPEHATVLEAHLLAGLAHRELGDHIAANQAVERALELAEPDRLVLPFMLSGSLPLLEALPRHSTAHAALLVDILDILHSASPPTADTAVPPWTLQLSASELKVLRYLPTNMSRPEIAGELAVSANTVSTHVRNIYAKLGADDRSGAVRRARQLRLLSGVGAGKR
jgi:LuxR family transcriptional regulator, maltose regulon positive regulatory protein